MDYSNSVTLGSRDYACPLIQSQDGSSYSEHQILNSSLLPFCLDTDASTETLSDKVFLEVYVLSGFHACILSRKGFCVVEQSALVCSYV